MTEQERAVQLAIYPTYKYEVECDRCGKVYYLQNGIVLDDGSEICDRCSEEWPYPELLR